VLRLLAAAGLAAALLAPRAALPVAAADDTPAAGDYLVPSGAFFTEALPDRKDGAGFAVQDGHGAKLWSEFQKLGGVPAVGYPLSRRFDWNGRVAQAFEGGVLRIDPSTGVAELVSARDLPGGKPPSYAIQPDQPPRASAELAQPPWSGWWWPASESAGPSFFMPNSPLDKYDRYVQLATGEDPGTRVWERQTIYYPAASWAGHCNGFAAAALLEPEPTEPREVLGVTFSVGDLKGLLTDYHFGDGTAWSYGDQDQELSPADFHRTLLNWMAGGQKGFVLTFDLGGGQVWSYPVYRFESAWGPDAQLTNVWHVTTTIWMADMDVPLNFVGTKPYPGPQGQTFEYTLVGDPRHPEEGTWTGGTGNGRFAHPGRIWYPEPSVRNLDRDLTSPNLDHQTVENILKPEVAQSLTR
jgi:transglutaminase elicitor